MKDDVAPQLGAGDREVRGAHEVVHHRRRASPAPAADRTRRSWPRRDRPAGRTAAPAHGPSGCGSSRAVPRNVPSSGWVSPKGRSPVPRSKTMGGSPADGERHAGGIAPVAPVGVGWTRARTPHPVKCHFHTLTPGLAVEPTHAVPVRTVGVTDATAEGRQPIGRLTLDRSAAFTGRRSAPSGPTHGQPVGDEASWAATRRPRRLVGPAGGGGDGVRRQPAATGGAGQTGQQPAPPLAVGPGESGLRPRGAGRAGGRVGAALADPGAWRRAGRTPGRAGRRRRPGAGPCRPWPRGRAWPGSTPSPSPGGTIRSASSWTAEPVEAAARHRPGQHPGGVGFHHPDRAVRRRRPARPGPCRGPPRAGPRGRPGRPEPRPRGGWRWRPRPGAGTPPAGCSRDRSTPRSPRRSARAAQASGSGQRARNSCHLGMTRPTWVWASMTSLTRIAHGSRVCRHGRSRRAFSPHPGWPPGGWPPAWARWSRRRRGRAPAAVTPRCRRRRDAGGPGRRRASRPSPCGGSSRLPRRAG